MKFGLYVKSWAYEIFSTMAGEGDFPWWQEVAKNEMERKRGKTENVRETENDFAKFQLPGM